ncbi:MAG TPA: alanine--tRNA ligase, partial [Nitrospirae bacterium]|nr:alanine--tRNA ligase [Nitrospirota bacterium]
ERLAAVLQGKTNNFDSDLFIPIIENVENISGKKYGADDVTNVSMRVIADHIRTTAFVLSEGLMPSNEGRGYVLRRIIRRAARHGFMLGIKGPFLYKVIDAVYDKMSGTYPELLESTDMIKKALKFEEERFAHTLSSGMEILDKLVKKVKSLKQTKLPGSELFKLYDTFGFPLDLAQDIADDNGLEVDHQGFNEEMERQKTTARASWIGTEDKPPQVYSEIKKELDHTEFLGYETLQSDASVVALIKKNKAADEAGEGEEAEIVLDRSPFYGESGGQVGDTGTIRADNMKFKVSYTKKINNILIHSGTVIRGTINKGMSVQAAVQEDRRRDIMRNHTATHLLHKALKEVLGDHIKQAGSLVAHDRLRFDFNHFFAMDEHEVSEVEEIVNEKIMENIPVDVTESSLDDAISKGVTALFGEKYGQKVRVVRGGDFTAELCGGTHCRATGEIGPFKIVSEGSVASGIRRIEALTGLSSLDFNRERENELKKAAGLLRVNEMGVSGKVKKIIADMKQNEKELEKIKNKATAGNAGGI